MVEALGLPHSCGDHDEVVEKLHGEISALQDARDEDRQEIQRLSGLLQVLGTGSRAQSRRRTSQKQDMDVLRDQNTALREDLALERSITRALTLQVTRLTQNGSRVEELESTVRVQQNDIRVLVQMRDEEVEELRSRLDKQNLPPPYAEVDSMTRCTKPSDAGPADAANTLASAMSSFRRAAAEAQHNKPTGPSPTHLITGFQNAMRTLNVGLTSNTWPTQTSSNILRFVTELCERLLLLQNILPNNNNNNNDDNDETIPLSLSQEQHLRSAFAAADTLAYEALLIHFASNGRRAEMAAAPLPFLSLASSPVDRRDEFDELRFWHRRFGVLAKDLGERFGDDGAVAAFENVLLWLEDAVVGALAFLPPV